MKVYQNTGETWVLEGVFTQFSPQTYPNCRDYHKYDWNWEDDRWELNMEHAKVYYSDEYAERLIEIEIENRDKKLERIFNEDKT